MYLGLCLEDIFKKHVTKDGPKCKQSIMNIQTKKKGIMEGNDENRQHRPCQAYTHEFNNQFIWNIYI